MQSVSSQRSAKHLKSALLFVKNTDSLPKRKLWIPLAKGEASGFCMASSDKT